MKEKMTMKERMDKVKKFASENKDAIVFACWGGLTFALGYGVCMNQAGLKKGRHVITDDKVNYLLSDLLKKYGKVNAVFHGCIDEGLTPSMMGELGAKMIECGADDTWKFTHFICAGPEHK